MISSNTDTNTKKSSKSTSPVNNNSQETSHHTSITDDDEDEDEIKRYINKHNHYTIIAVFEGRLCPLFKRVEEWRTGRRKYNITRRI